MELKRSRNHKALSFLKQILIKNGIGSLTFLGPTKHGNKSAVLVIKAEDYREFFDFLANSAFFQGRIDIDGLLNHSEDISIYCFITKQQFSKIRVVKVIFSSQHKDEVIMDPAIVKAVLPEIGLPIISNFNCFTTDFEFGYNLGASKFISEITDAECIATWEKIKYRYSVSAFNPWDWIALYNFSRKEYRFVYQSRNWNKNDSNPTFIMFKQQSTIEELKMY